MAAPPLRIGIVGAARVAVYAMLAPAAAHPGATVLAVAARDRGRAEAYARTHAIPRAYGGYAALIADPDIDLVYVATPPAHHVAPALAAIAAGKAVLVEKPFALDAADAERVRDAAGRAGAPVFEAMHSRHHALHARLAALVGGGAIGAVRRVTARFVTPTPGESDFRHDAALGGGALMDLGVYPLAWTRALLGEDFVVAAARARRGPGGVDHETAATLRFAGGAAADILARHDAERFDARLAIEGERGRIEVVNPLAPQIGHTFTVETDAGAQSETVDGPGTFDAQLAAVVATVRDGAPFPLPPDDYVRSMRAIDLVRDACR